MLHLVGIPLHQNEDFLLPIEYLQFHYLHCFVCHACLTILMLRCVVLQCNQLQSDHCHRWYGLHPVAFLIVWYLLPCLVPPCLAFHDEWQTSYLVSAMKSSPQPVLPWPQPPPSWLFNWQSTSMPRTACLTSSQALHACHFLHTNVGNWVLWPYDIFQDHTSQASNRVERVSMQWLLPETSSSGLRYPWRHSWWYDRRVGLHPSLCTCLSNRSCLQFWCAPNWWQFCSAQTKGILQTNTIDLWDYQPVTSSPLL